jgi:hypothetical protein
MNRIISLFLFIFIASCLNGQYNSPIKNKVTLGVQTTADGLVWRGLAADTTRKPSVDTMAYILLDTNTNIIWQYKKAVNNAWTRLNLRQSDTTSFNYVNTYGTQTINGAKTFTSDVAGISFNLNKIDTDYVSFVSLNLNNNASLSTSNSIKFGFKSTVGNHFGIFKIKEGANNSNGGNFSLSLPFGGFDQERLTILANGATGISVSNPLARLHITASSSAVSTAPLKFNSGSLLSAVETGVFEFYNGNLYFTPIDERQFINHGFKGSASLNFPSTLTLSSADLIIAVTGAEVGDVVSLGVPNAAVNANTCYTAWVSAASTVTVRFNNYSSGTVDPAQALFKVFVTK